MDDKGSNTDPYRALALIAFLAAILSPFIILFQLITAPFRFLFDVITGQVGS